MTRYAPGIMFVLAAIGFVLYLASGFEERAQKRRLRTQRELEGQ